MEHNFGLARQRRRTRPACCGLAKQWTNWTTPANLCGWST